MRLERTRAIDEREMLNARARLTTKHVPLSPFLNGTFMRQGSGQLLTKRCGISWEPKEPHGSFLPDGERYVLFIWNYVIFSSIEFKSK